LTQVVGIPFVEPLDGLVYGTADRLSPLVARVVAENPSKFTYKGTGTYIIGREDVVVIDPGPDLDAHRSGLEHALDGKRVRGIVVTHCHSDHVPLSYWLRESTGAPTFAFGPHPRPAPSALFDDDPTTEDDEKNDKVGDGEEREHTDFDFVPDIAVRDGERFIDVDDWSLTAVHTPGHTSNHLCVHLDAENALFTGDHIMGWSTTVVSPPDGNMTDYMESVRKLTRRNDAILYPTHGNPVRDPAPFLAAYLEHRIERETQILTLLTKRPSTIREIVEVLYANVRRELHKPARRSVLSHMLKLREEGRVAVMADAPVSMRATWKLQESSL
jgi:glyoxylase-like metal-dependent hydrolase (beta-lactamase superfamily II)